jgi:hypothetical protein
MRFAFRLFSVWFLCCIFNFSARAEVRAGAPRPLGENNGFIEGTHAHFENGELNFVRVRNARPQLWRAFLEDPDAKIPAWSTHAHREQSPYLLDVLASQRTLSPDGKMVAFVSQRGGQSAIYIVRASDFGRQERAHRVTTQAQSPTWLDGSTLLFESTNAQRGGLFRISILGDEKAHPEPQLLFSRGGESAAAPDGQTICVAAKNDNARSDENATQLYLLSADGSGARAIPQTEGARRPCFAPDGTAIFFDAPAPGVGAQSGSTPRVLWTVPLTTAPPTAQLFFVRPDRNGDAEIIGTLFSGETGDLQSQIEFWPGEETEFATRPQFVLPVKTAPINNAPLLTWPLPHNGAPQEWTLRLRATDATGQSAQSTLTFLWPPAKTLQPLPAAPVVEMPVVKKPVAQQPIVKQPTVKQPTTQPPVVAAPVMATTVAPFFPPPATTSAPKTGGGQTPKFPDVLADLPAPALPAAPGAVKGNLSPVPPPVQAAPRAGSTPGTSAPFEMLPVRRSLPQAQAKKAPAEKAAPKKPAGKPKPPKAPPKSPQKSGGIPSQMKAGSSTSVEVTLRNTGTRSWSSTGESPVRLLIRWVRADSRTRHRWAIKWLRQTVAPGQSTKVTIDLDAPSTPGRYILTYSLVRLGPEIYDGKSYKPPPATAADARWPGEFGAVSYEIDVR